MRHLQRTRRHLQSDATGSQTAHATATETPSTPVASAGDGSTCAPPPSEPVAGGACVTSYGADGVWVNRESCSSDDSTEDSYGDTCTEYYDALGDCSDTWADLVSAGTQCCTCGGGFRSSFLSCEVTDPEACPPIEFDEGFLCYKEIPFVWSTLPYALGGGAATRRTGSLCFTYLTLLRSVMVSISSEDDVAPPLFVSSTSTTIHPHLFWRGL